ncbi:NAD(P)-dependent oxidoreductase [Spongiibacter sp. KMU-158]|uniref:NAD(P)-dependent oxidoreductase n=1 Tax=Spongiibacter pelagi TaxID=2760804 RepID=A0A927C472_9GAMM|nr:NAD(P)-dependent oxidoreductase [Spongiibacter pelagi]MBD2859853.1 NAD(P)-dependent oxidoreductase [Spongiibacter pelagi]
MNVLVTGAFGNLGQLCIEQLLADGHQVRCTDIDTPNQRQIVEKSQGRFDIRLGDIRDKALLAELLVDIDAVIHLASLLPPMTERNPSLAYSVNVEASKTLIELAQALPTPPLFIYPSSLTVFGPSQRDNPIRHSSDPVMTSDNYTAHKIEIERVLHESSLPWIIMRIGVSVDARTLRTERQVFKQLLAVHPDTPMEYVHPRDIALAMSRAVSTPAAIGKTLLLGGGKHCQITHHRFLNAAFKAMGLPQKPGIHGQDSYYTHWLDTHESQALLQYQRSAFEEYENELAVTFSRVRKLTTPIRPLLKWLMPKLLRRI